MSDNQRKTRGALLGLHAQTAVHAGTGTALGVVDLPIQRERHTNFPTVAGSALKGILRDTVRTHLSMQANLDELERFDDTQSKPAERCGSQRDRANATLKLTEIFGPPTEGSSEYAGALSVTDARILCFPVRSMRGVFAWVTCPFALQRLERDIEMAGLPKPNLGNYTMLERHKGTESVAGIAKDSPLVVPNTNPRQIVLEEYDFRAYDAADPEPAAQWIASHLMPTGEHYAATRGRFHKTMVLLSDDDFTHFVTNATEVNARIGLEYETKTVKEGALFYQEFLPAEAILYTVVLANPSRSRRSNTTGAEMLKVIETALNSTQLLQIGGDETTGKGFCATRLNTGGNQ